ncbi:MAG: AlpA family phage regulatory protein [Pseudorhodobacter sp.]|nr:AlpA family phage regulatory protein [Rhizobacter sp.]
MLILRLRHVMAKTGLSRSTIYNFVNAGSFPQRVLLGERAVGWYEHDIDAWLVGRVHVQVGRILT